MNEMKKILLIGTGGTIASDVTDSGLAPELTTEQLLSHIPGISDICGVDCLQLLNLDSTNMTPAHWLEIAACIREHYGCYDGFVITHGTDTMAYTAAALSYLIQHSPKPIIITGAQKPIDMENTDARTNLADSLLFASCPGAHDVNIVFDGKVIAGTRGKKEWTKSYHAFSSINFPYVAIIQDGQIIFYLDDKDRDKKPVCFYRQMDGDVGLMKLIPSMDASLLDYMAEHYDAVIIESFGVGGLPSYQDGDYHGAIARWTGLGKTVIMTTQVTNEGSDMSVYEVGRSIKQEFGLLEAYDMTLEAVVTKIMWILGQTKDPARIRRMFYETVNRDILWKWSEN